MADSSIAEYAPGPGASGPVSVASLGIPALSVHAEQFHILRQVTEANVLGLWDATIGPLPTLDQGAAELWGEAVGPLIGAAQQEALTMTQAFLENVISAALERRISAALDRRVLLRDLRNGATNGHVYHRPMKTARTVMSVGGTREQANVEAKKRLSRLVHTDLQLVKTKTTQAMLIHPSVGEEIQWYKRALKGDYNCGLCMYASTRTYYKADLMPIHPGCDCEPVPMTSDPRKIVADPELLQQLKDAGIEDTLEDVVLYKHGEYGPTLVKRGHRHLPYGDTNPDHRLTLTEDMLEKRETRPVLGGYLADTYDEMGRRRRPPDWGEVVGAVGEKVEVASGPMVTEGAGSFRSDTPPGPGVAFVTEDGRLFYAEYDVILQDDEKRRSAERMIDRMLWDERMSLPRWTEGAPADLVGTPWAPPDVVLALQASNKTVPDEDGYAWVIEADAGRGRIVHYNGAVRSETVWHENGHIVAGAVNRLGQSGLFSDKIDPEYYGTSNAPGSKWAEAMNADAAWLLDADFGSPTEGTFAPAGRDKVLRYGRFEAVRGVTPYGSTSPTEDFAESWRLFVEGEVGTYRPEGSDEWQSLMFEDMFPNRYAYLKELERQIGGVEFPDNVLGADMARNEEWMG